MEETTKLEQGKELEVNEGNSSFDFATLYRTIVLNWYWFVLSLIIFGSLGAIYLRYATPMYQATAKLLINRETVRSLSIAGARNLKGAAPSTRGPEWTNRWCTNYPAKGTVG